MIIEQFYDRGLAQASYAIVSDGKMGLIDPARDPAPYLAFAKQQGASIQVIIETHPHADFVSAHLELHEKTGATIYVSRLLDADYSHQTFDDGDVIILGKLKLQAINTPGHSPDSICILLLDEYGHEHAVFTGDTLFVGDVGRPDLRENVGNLKAKKEELARAMYHSIRKKLLPLAAHVLVYPAHGPGSLCGKSMGSELYSTMAQEIRDNYALQLMDEMAFVKNLLEDQPFVPQYFEYDVMLNKKGAAPLEDSIARIPRLDSHAPLKEAIPIIDTRAQAQFKAGHWGHAFNLQDGTKFETWLGAIIAPGESFYLLASDEDSLDKVIRKTAKIGYEGQIAAALLAGENMTHVTPAFDIDDFIKDPKKFTIVDIRNRAELKLGKIFPSAITIPLPELRARILEIPRDKPIVVHCAAGYRSAVGSSILEQQIKEVPVLDMSDDIIAFATKKSCSNHSNASNRFYA